MTPSTNRLLVTAMESLKVSYALQIPKLATHPDYQCSYLVACLFFAWRHCSKELYPWHTSSQIETVTSNIFHLSPTCSSRPLYSTPQNLLGGANLIPLSHWYKNTQLEVFGGKCYLMLNATTLYNLTLELEKLHSTYRYEVCHYHRHILGTSWNNFFFFFFWGGGGSSNPVYLWLLSWDLCRKQMLK